MTIHTYQPGDEEAQAHIYNEAAAALSKFKPATPEEVNRRVRARDFDPGTRFYAEVGGKVVGYAVFQPNGRVSYPWCLPGHESQAEPLFDAVVQAMKARGMTSAFAAYRADWPVQCAFFTSHGFPQAREMINFVLDFVDMPTPAARPSNSFSPLLPADVAMVYQLDRTVVRVPSPAELERYLFHNPYFTPEALFALRNQADGSASAVGILVTSPTYGNPKQVDPFMPCFRLGAFGTEGMQVKRINGLFSFLAKGDRDVTSLGLDLMTQAAGRLQETDLECIAAQVPSDAPHLLRFYQRMFRRQGSFPVFERAL